MDGSYIRRQGRRHEAFRKLRADLPTWYLELVADTAARLTAWQDARPKASRPPMRRQRVDVSSEQAELCDRLRRLNPRRWSDARLAELLGVTPGAVRSLATRSCLAPV